jgi:uncharacterized protein
MLYDLTVPQFTKMLQNLARFFDKAAAHADQKKFDVNVLLQSRLAPDQFPLVRQVQVACDTAKLATARLTGREAPSHPDTEQTLDQLRARVESTIAYLSTATREDFAQAAERRITQPRWNGRSLSGAEYAVQHALPNFYFHVTTAYALLRHNGVDLGKMDYLGALPFRDPA